MDLIKESKAIHNSLLKRWKELEKKNADIIHDAEERGMTLTKSQMSTYVNKGVGLTQVQIIWLCLRYQIPILLQVGSPEIIGGEIKYVIQKFDEIEAIKNLNKHKELFK